MEYPPWKLKSRIAIPQVIGWFTHENNDPHGYVFLKYQVYGIPWLLTAHYGKIETFVNNHYSIERRYGMNCPFLTLLPLDDMLHWLADHSPGASCTFYDEHT